MLTKSSYLEISIKYFINFLTAEENKCIILADEYKNKNLISKIRYKICMEIDDSKVRKDRFVFVVLNTISHVETIYNIFGHISSIIFLI